MNKAIKGKRTRKDDRKTIPEQMVGFHEEILKNQMEGDITLKPKVKCLVPHSQIATGQRCTTCGRQKF